MARIAKTDKMGNGKETLFVRIGKTGLASIRIGNRGKYSYYFSYAGPYAALYRLRDRLQSFGCDKIKVNQYPGKIPLGLA